MQYDVYFRCYIYDGSRIGVTYVTRVYVSSVIPVSLPFIQHAASSLLLRVAGGRPSSWLAESVYRLRMITEDYSQTRPILQRSIATLPHLLFQHTIIHYK